MPYNYTKNLPQSTSPRATRRATPPSRCRPATELNSTPPRSWWPWGLLSSCPAFFLKVTGKSGDTFTVDTTGFDGSTVAKMSAGAYVVQVITAGVFADLVVRGAAALVDVNRIPKVTAAGTLGESSLTDDGTQITTVENVGIGNGAATPGALLEVAGTLIGGISPNIFLTNYTASGVLMHVWQTALPLLQQLANAGQRIGGFLGAAYNSGGSFANTALLGFYTLENQTNTARGSYVTIETVSAGTTTRTERVRVTDKVMIGAGTQTDDGSGALVQIHGDTNLSAGQAYKIDGVAQPTPGFAWHLRIGRAHWTDSGNRCDQHSTWWRDLAGRSVSRCVYPDIVWDRRN